MRKLMNKKGFSLVELMIVVVIMGILIAVAIPLYGAIKDNANNKTCANNIKTIKSNAANYMASYNAKVANAQNLKDMFDDGKLPDCPLNATPNQNSYAIEIQSNGSAKVNCLFIGTSGNDFHTAAKVGADGSGTTAGVTVAS